MMIGTEKKEIEQIAHLRRKRVGVFGLGSQYMIAVKVYVSIAGHARCFYFLPSRCFYYLKKK